MAPSLAELNAEDLKQILIEAEKWSPRLPQPDFMNAWLGAARLVMTQLRPPTWVLAEQLGAKPDREFLKEFGLAARELQLASPEFSFFHLLEVQCKWGATAATVGPFLDMWQKAHSRHIRVTGHVRSGLISVFRYLDCMPSDEFVQEWVHAASVHLPTLAHADKAESFWSLVNAATQLPVEDPAVLYPVFDSCAAMRPACEHVPVKKIVNLMIGLADLGYKPSQALVKDLANAVLKKLPEAENHHSVVLMKAFSELVVPARDAKVVDALLVAWVEAILPHLCMWKTDVLVSALAVVVRLQAGPSVIGQEWFKAWQRAASALCGFDPIFGSVDNPRLLHRCQELAFRIFLPTQFIDNSWTAATVAIRAMRDLQDMRTLRLDDPKLTKLWVEHAKAKGSFRKYHVQRAAQYLRDLGASDAAVEWEAHHAAKTALV